MNLTVPYRTVCRGTALGAAFHGCGEIVDVGDTGRSLMKNLSIARRLQIMVSVAIVALIVLAVSSAQVATNLRGSMTYTYINALPSIVTISDINEKFLRLRLLVLYHFAVKEGEKKASLESQIRHKRRKFARTWRGTTKN